MRQEYMELNSTPHTPPWRARVYIAAVRRSVPALTNSWGQLERCPGMWRSCRWVGVPQRETLMQQQRHDAGHLHPQQHSCGNLKFRRTNEKYGRKQKSSLGFRLDRWRRWGSFAAETGVETAAAQDNCQLPTKQNTSAITSFLHISVSVPLPTCFFVVLHPSFRTFPECHSSDTQTCTHCWIVNLHRKSQCW